MGFRTIAAALATAFTVSISAPGAAVTVPIDYSVSTLVNGKNVTFGNLVLDYNGSVYSLSSLELTLRDKSIVATSDVTLSPVSGTSDYCLYTFSACSIVPEKNSLYVIFDPSLMSQTSNLYVYSTKNLATESLPVTIQSVPEPATWAMMLVGFGAIGFAMRRRSSPQPA